MKSDLPQTSRRAGLAHSPTMANAALASAHPDVIDLSVGEPEDGPEPGLLERGLEEARRRGVRYGPAAGLAELREALAARESALSGAAFASSQTVVTNGGKHALAEALRVLVDPDTEVVLFAPYWPSYVQQIELCDARVVVVPPRPDGRPDVGALGRHIGPRTRAVIVNDPVNPTGTEITAAEYEALARCLAGTPIWLLHDAVYRALVFDDTLRHPLAVDATLRERLVTIDSFSKGHALSGARVGFAAGPEPVIQAMTRMIAATTTCVAAPIQWAALFALLDGQAALTARRVRYARRARAAVEELRAVPGVDCPQPTGGFYLFPRFAGHVDDVAFAAHLRSEHGVKTCPGSHFGAPGRLRIATTVPDGRLHEALRRVAEAAQ